MTKEEICQFVCASRTKQNLSQSDLANLIGKRRQAIFEIEKNMVDFRIASFLNVIEALGYTLEIVPINKETIFDFKNIKPARPEQPIGPFKKTKTKKK
jgi:DNA-binding XRE family transcriptional regulator